MSIKLILYVIFFGIFLLLGNLSQDIFADVTGTVRIIKGSVTIVSITANDPDGGDSIFSNGDTIIVEFSEDTNKPDVATKADLDALFTFSHSLGNNYSGSWKNSSTLIITILDSTGNANPSVGTFTMTLKAAGNLKVAGGQSLASTDASPALQGSFGDRAGPYITNILADDPDGGDSIFSNGDTIIVEFSEDTNKPDVATKADLDALFTFSHSLGNNYSGSWKNSSTLIITILDSTGNANPSVGTFTMTLKAAGNLKVAGGQSLASTDASPALQGSFGTFSTTLFADSGEVVTTVLPAGTTVEVKLPVAGGMKITRTSASTSIDAGTITFVGDVIDIIPVNGASCTSGCVIIITFTQDDLTGNQAASDISIFHDTNGDGSFSKDEELSTVITTDSSGVFTANATTFSNSKFAAGSTSFPKTGGGGGGGGGGNPPIIKASSISSKNSAIFGGTLKLEPFAKTPSKSLFETGDQIDLEFSIYEDGGFQALQHVGLYTNLRGDKREYHNSDAIILYDKGKPLDVYDPNGFWRDDISVTTKGDGRNINDVIFHITFVKPMPASDIVIYTWDFKRNGVRESFPDIWQIVESVKIESQETPKIIPPTKESEPKPFPKTYDIPRWVKSQAGAWAKDYLPETHFVTIIHYLINEQIIDNVSEYAKTDVSTKKIPYWLKNNAVWWSDEFITDEDFIQAIQWLLDKKIIQV